MSYTIMSGKFETGTEEQKMGYAMLFGQENIQYKFDLYFHWYNLVHEVGHCVVEACGKQMSPLMEEMFVNEFAVGYYRFVGDDERLSDLQAMLQASVDNMPSPVPEGESFEEYYSRIWGTDELMSVMVYGYLQLNSVLMALKKDKPFGEILAELGLSVSDEAELSRCGLDVVSENAAAFLNSARENLIRLGVDVPEIRLQLLDDPMVQCARPE
ncbi:MAG: hypothetical protein IK106_05265 [Clostridiales bacterium]|nr:hypothetical protein [Clostridiales bacterium]